jgi:hypothetical protein
VLIKAEPQTCLQNGTGDKRKPKVDEGSRKKATSAATPSYKLKSLNDLSSPVALWLETERAHFLHREFTVVS